MADIRAVIADDEPLARRVIRTLLGHHPDITVVAECRNGREVVAATRQHEPHLLFLDVQMPELDGFGALRALGAQSPAAVVLVTAYDEFAVRAFEAEALDFLVKPFSDERFHQTIRRIRDRLAQGEVAELARRLSGLVGRLEPSATPGGQSGWRTHLTVTSGSRSMAIAVPAIRWIEADDYYARVHVGERSHLYRCSLTHLETELDPRQFIRVHRSALINLARVREVVRSGAGASVILDDGTRLPVSERRRALVLRAIRGHSEGGTAGRC